MKAHCLAGAGALLRDGDLLGAGFAHLVAVQGGNQVAADNDGIGIFPGD